MPNIGGGFFSGRVRRGFAVVAGAGLAVALVAAPLGAAVPSKARSPKLTFSGAVSGKSKGGQVNCTESTGLHGLQLGVSLNNMKLPKYSNANLSFVFAGPNDAPGTYQFGGPTSTSTGVPVTFSPGGGQGFISGEGNGTATLNSDKKSGKIDGDLIAGSAVAATGGPGVHVKGSFKCGKIAKV